MYELTILAVCVAAALLTYEIGTVRKKGAVRASALTGMLFGLPPYLLSLADITLGAFEAIPAAAIGASFAGMSSASAIPSRTWMAVSGGLFSGIFLFSSPVFAGNGGGLGISACIAVIITLGAIKMRDLAARRR